MADVFLSYSRKDREAAERIARALEGAGFSVWWDRQIDAGESFDRRIEEELEHAACVLALWSASSIDSEWVKNEAAAAMERNALIPVLLEPVRLPIEFRRRQAVDLSAWDGRADHSEFAALLRSLAGRQGRPRPEASAPPAASPPGAARRGRPIAVAVSALAVLALAAAAYWASRGDQAAEEKATPALTYAMTCLGGGPFGVRRDAGDVRISFVPARTTASDPMSPGQCGWPDRALSRNEPHELCDTAKRSSQLLAELEKARNVITVRVAYEPATHCFRVFRF